MSAIIAIRNNMNLEIISIIKSVIFDPFRMQSFQSTLHVFRDINYGMKFSRVLILMKYSDFGV